MSESRIGWADPPADAGSGTTAAAGPELGVPFNPAHNGVPATAPTPSPFAAFNATMGPLAPLLEDDRVSEVMVNGPNQIYVEIGGLLQPTDIVFESEAQLMDVIAIIARSVGRQIGAGTPLMDARLPDGSRVHAAVPPVVLSGPTLTIRKFPAKPLNASDLVQSGSISVEGLAFLDACVRGRANILVSGGTGSGKTTLLNVLSSFIPETDRIITIEDAAELQLHQRHVVRMESRPVNPEGAPIPIRELVINALRMRPTRIVIGECRGSEALDMLQAMNTGHDGSLTTLHANSPRDGLVRVETMVLMAGYDLPMRAIRTQISNAFNLVVQVERMRDGTRKIVQISEVLGMEGETIQLQDVFVFKGRQQEDGHYTGGLESTGLRPSIVDRMYGRRVPMTEALMRLFPDRRPQR